MKVVFPAVWLGGWSLGIVVALVRAGLEGAAGGVYLWIAILLYVVVQFGSIFIYAFGIRLQSVSMDDDALYVSNFLKEARILLSEVQTVEQDSIPNTRPITVTFVRPTVFGKSIVFMGRMGLFDWKDIDPVELIREAAASARLAASLQSVASADAASSDSITTAPAPGARVAPRTEITNQGPGDIRKEDGKR